MALAPPHSSNSFADLIADLLLTGQEKLAWVESGKPVAAWKRTPASGGRVDILVNPALVLWDLPLELMAMTSDTNLNV